jgi:hypothetical protein
MKLANAFGDEDYVKSDDELIPQKDKGNINSD